MSLWSDTSTIIGGSSASLISQFSTASTATITNSPFGKVSHLYFLIVCSVSLPL